MNLLSIVSTSLYITIMDVNLSILNDLCLMKLNLLLFMSYVFGIFCTWYVLHPALSMTMYGTLALSTNLDGLHPAELDITCFMMIKMYPSLGILVCID